MRSAVVTKAKYDNIRTGMSYPEVLTIISHVGEKLSRSDGPCDGHVLVAKFRWIEHECHVPGWETGQQGAVRPEVELPSWDGPE
jgi:hypothetical protein